MSVKEKKLIQVWQDTTRYFANKDFVAPILCDAQDYSKGSAKEHKEETDEVNVENPLDEPLDQPLEPCLNPSLDQLSLQNVEQVEEAQNVQKTEKLESKSENTQAEIEVLDIDCLELARKYVEDENLNVMVLNMASAIHPGGGVSRGRTAQEECIFRRSNAHLTHPKEWYPLKATQMIYSPQVRVTKDADHDRIKEFQVGMLAVAALRKPALTSQGEYKRAEDLELMRLKIDAIFQVPSNADTMLWSSEPRGVESLRIPFDKWRSSLNEAFVDTSPDLKRLDLPFWSFTIPIEKT